MKRFRLSTLLLIVVIAALCLAVVVQQRRIARLESELETVRPSKIIETRNVSGGYPAGLEAKNEAFESLKARKCRWDAS